MVGVGSGDCVEAEDLDWGAGGRRGGGGKDDIFSLALAEAVLNGFTLFFAVFCSLNNVPAANPEPVIDAAVSCPSLSSSSSSPRFSRFRERDFVEVILINIDVVVDVARQLSI